MQGRLRGRVALVTGASRNIGAAIAERLARSGAAVAVNYANGESGARNVVDSIDAAGGVAMSVQADVGNEREVRTMVQAVKDHLGCPDVIVNNAARSVSSERPWSDLAVSHWDETLRVNVTGAFVVLRAIDSLCGLDGASVVNISSIRAVTGKPGNLHYTASKSGQIGMTRALAAELGPRGTRVNALLVGAIRTPEEARYGPPDAIDREVLAQQALPRRGAPDDVASTVEFLASDDAAFITGQSLAVDGGWIFD